MKLNLVRTIGTGGILLALGFAGCACSGSSGDDPRAENPSPAAPQPGAALSGERPSAAKPVFKGPGTLLPQKMPDWKITSQPRYFGNDDLYDLINGGAEIYTEFGLTEMVTADYQSPAHKAITITVEIYDMGSALGAFGRCARFLKERKDPSTAGQGLADRLSPRAIFGGTDLVFWKGHHLVHIVLLDESPAATLDSMNALGATVLPHFAEIIDQGISGSTDLSPMLALFPGEQRLARSDAWEKTDLAGIKGLGSGFSVRYSEGKTDWTVFVSDPVEPPGAIDALLSAATRDSSAAKQGLRRVEDRIIGYTTQAQTLTEAQQQGAAKQLKKLEKSLQAL